MTRAPARSAALLALFVLLAGCAELASPPPASEAEAAADASSASPAADSPEGAEALAADAGMGSHAHDYWSGRERVTLVDQDVTIEAPDVLVWGVMSTRVFREPSFGGAFIDMPEGALVYEGTGRLEIVTTWSDATITGLRFVHRDAGSGEVKPWIETPSGETIAIEVTPAMTDMPHAQVSRWGFLFAASGVPAVASGTFHIRIDIVRTRDIAEWPAHPDHWDGRDEIVLADADGASTQSLGPSLLEDPWAEPEDAVPSSAIVPMDAATLRVTVTVLSADETADSLRLLLRTASDVHFDFDEVGEPTDVSDDGSVWTWELPIEMDQTDNPYAEQSAWGFRVRAYVDAAQDLPPCELGCYEGEVQYRLVATVAQAPASAA